MSFDIRTLKQFLKIAETRSMSRAADELLVTQPALSYSIRNLENLLGTRLFNRTSGGLIVTEAGERLEQHARAIVKAVEQAEADLRHLDREPSGPVSIGITIGLAGLLSIPILDEVRRRHPRIFLSIVEMPSGALLAMLKAGEIDLAVSYVSENSKLVVKDKLADHQYHLCGRRDEVERLGVRQVALRQICRLPLVMMSRRNGQRALIEAAVARESRELDVVAEIDSSSGLKRAMLAGYGFSVFPQAALQPELDQGLLSAIPIVEPEIWRPLYLSALPRALPSGGVRALREVVRTVIGTLG